ncbi:hypothetical protein TTRE_0000851601 [Trichuris trichiura]|uniref:Uncharacterized protein n=1 Tax=Trichuris trichiura TaxID=36087 RepID=A0A077ZK87_TRITR|nr:hypothetical protein TTRE_0000851601 [Trichuris trichiura]
MEKLVLTKGLNYVPTTKRVSILNTVRNVEAALHKLDECKANEIRCAVSNVLLSQMYQPKLNSTPFEFHILNRLKMDTSITTTKADKGNAVVIIDKCPIAARLKNCSARQPVRIPDGLIEPTPKSPLHLIACYGEQSGDQRIVAISKPSTTASNSKSPELYCLSKGHKPDILSRPIVSSSNFMTSALSKYIATLLNFFAGKRQSHVSYSRELLNAVKTTVEPPKLTTSLCRPPPKLTEL